MGGDSMDILCQKAVSKLEITILFFPHFYQSNHDTIIFWGGITQALTFGKHFSLPETFRLAVMDLWELFVRKVVMHQPELFYIFFVGKKRIKSKKKSREIIQIFIIIIIIYIIYIIYIIMATSLKRKKV